MTPLLIVGILYLMTAVISAAVIVAYVLIKWWKGRP